MPFSAGCEVAARMCEQIVTACWCVMAIGLGVALAVTLVTPDPNRR